MKIKTPQSGVLSPSGSIEFTRIKASIWAGYKPNYFCDRLDPEWQARVIAAYIFDSQLQAVLQQSSEKKNRDRASSNSNQGQERGRGSGGANKPNPAAPRRTDSFGEFG
jgi:hypothetical protein